jgi:hypothetical protein
MSARHPRVLCLVLSVCLLAASGCGDDGGQASFASSKVEAVPTNVSGSGTTSGIGAGAAIAPGGAAPAAGGSPTPTVTPTVTPAPTK